MCAITTSKCLCLLSSEKTYATVVLVTFMWCDGWWLAGKPSPTIVYKNCWKGDIYIPVQQSYSECRASMSSIPLCASWSGQLVQMVKELEKIPEMMVEAVNTAHFQGWRTSVHVLSLDQSPRNELQEFSSEWVWWRLTAAFIDKGGDCE